MWWDEDFAVNSGGVYIFPPKLSWGRTCGDIDVIVFSTARMTSSRHSYSVLSELLSWGRTCRGLKLCQKSGARAEESVMSIELTTLKSPEGPVFIGACGLIEPDGRYTTQGGDQFLDPLGDISASLTSSTSACSRSPSRRTAFSISGVPSLPPSAITLVISRPILPTR